MGRDAYHRFYEGYTEEKLPGDDGKMHTKRTYRDFLYVPKLTDRQRILRGAGLLALGLGGAAIMILGASQKAACNTAWYSVLAMGLSLISLLIEAIPLFTCVTAPAKQTVYQYKSGHRTCVLWARITAGCMALTALLSLIAGIPRGEAFALPVPLFLLACACEAAVGQIEAAIPYEKQTNSNA